MMKDGRVSLCSSYNIDTWIKVPASQVYPWSNASLPHTKVEGSVVKSTENEISLPTYQPIYQGVPNPSTSN